MYVILLYIICLNNILNVLRKRNKISKIRSMLEFSFPNFVFLFYLDYKCDNCRHKKQNYHKFTTSRGLALS